MANNEFERLVENRKDWVRSSKENKFDFDSILAGLYIDPSHFIYEILQNAEDEGAKEVRFELLEDRLNVYHNGNDFYLEDIDGVTGIGISKKKDDLTSIGKFGVGFKSVFAVTETPYIFSGEYNIKIEDFVIPSVVTNEQIKGTLIRLPFNHKLRSHKEVFTLVSKKLENIGLKIMLFLKNIEEIKWQTPSTSGHYLKLSESFQTIQNAKRVTIKSSSVSEEYIVIGKPIKIEGKDLRVEVAYKLGKDKNGEEIIIPESDSKLVVYFPTEKVTYLNFVVQGPYKTTPNRENIPLEDKQNKAILEKTANLVAESLSVIKDLCYLDTNFLSLLPVKPEDKEKELIYSVMYDKVKEKLLSDEELLPSIDEGNYTKASESLLADGKKLTGFLTSDDIQELFSKRNWLDTNITDAKTRELRSYLMKELKNPEVNFESFARKITVEFLQTKSDEWMIDFYSELLDQQSLWSDSEKGILRTKPIIRLENDEHIAPFDNNGKVQVYLPAETRSKYKTVKRILTENKNSSEFLKKLGLTEPDIFAEIKEFIIPKYHIDNPTKDEWYLEDFEKLLKAYETIPANKEREFIEELLKTSSIDSVNNVTGKHTLLKPLNIYLRDSGLKDYFQGSDSVYFISDELYERFEEERLTSFLKELGAEDKPRRIEMEKVADLPREEKVKFVGDTGRDVHEKDYEYEGLSIFIEQMTINKSYLLWKLLLRNIEKMSTWKARKFFEGKYSWLYQTERSRSFDAKFVKTLRQQAWLVDKNNNFRKPSDVAFSELSDNYNKESPNIDILIKVLEFEPEIIDQLPEDYRKKLEITKDFTVEELEKLISERKPPDKEEKTWTPKVNPDTVKVTIEGGEPDKIITPDLTGQGGQIGIGKDNEPTNNHEKQKNGDVHITPNDRKAIGICGEKHVYNALKEKCQELGSINETDSGFKVINADDEEFEIIWLNKHHDMGKGYDFVVKKNEAEIKYIEVKAKTQEAEELIDATGTQWEFARKLFEQNEGEKYSFYVVLNTGEANARILRRKNPIKLWKEGKLYAHPVKFKL
jgi:hypothetical protein